MNKQRLLLSFITASFAILLLVVIRSIQSNQNGSTEAPIENQNTVTPVVNSAVTKTAPIASAAQYEVYSAEAVTAALATNRRVVLYFHANWCPICKVLDPSITADITSFPTDVTILKVDYDKETALKKTYGVTYQHTFVQIDSDLKKVKLWSGTTEARDILENLQ